MNALEYGAAGDAFRYSAFDATNGVANLAAVMSPDEAQCFLEASDFSARTASALPTKGPDLLPPVSANQRAADR